MAEKIEEAPVISGLLELPYENFVGAVGSKFLIGLRDEKKIFGMRCPTCNRVLMPARSICPKCYTHLDEWVEVGDKGTVLTYSTVYYGEPVQPVEPPITYGVIQLDGADTGIVHMIQGADPACLHIGMRVEAVFKEERTGSVLDIKYFKPL